MSTVSSERLEPLDSSDRAEENGHTDGQEEGDVYGEPVWGVSGVWGGVSAGVCEFVGWVGVEVSAWMWTYF